MVDRWISYRDFVFEYDKAEIRPSETSTVSEIAAYMKQNPSLRVGIDGTMDLRGTDPRNQELSDRRVNAVRDALMQAGVSAEKISIGAFGDANLRRDRRVEVLICTLTIADQIVNPDKTIGVRDTIARGREHYGMQTIDQHLTELYNAGIISLEVALDAASNPSDFQRALTFE